MRGLDQVVADRLVKVVGRFGSDFSGERDAALAAATRILRDNGMDWPDLVLAGSAVPSNPTPTSPTMLPQELARQILLGKRDLLSPWEARFTESLARWRGRVTPKQAARLAQLRTELKTRGTSR